MRDVNLVIAIAVLVTKDSVTRMLCSASKDSDALLRLEGLAAYCVGFASMIIAYCVGFASMIIACCVGFASMGRGLPSRGCHVRVGVGSAVSSRLLLVLSG